MDPWKELEIARGASRQEIRRAYLRLARSTHPDCNDDPAAHQRFLRVRAAYEMLTGTSGATASPEPVATAVRVTPGEIIAAARAVFLRELQKHGMRLDSSGFAFNHLGMRIVMRIA